MYCILVTGIPASGKSTMAQYLSEQLNIPMFSKDSMKELLFDEIGFKSRAEKVKLGIAAMNMMYYAAEQMMKCDLPFILENNFEYASEAGLRELLDRYSYKAITITLTGDYQIIYNRFVERDKTEGRHRGHVVNDCYPEIEPNRKVETISYENYVAGIKNRGMDAFVANGPHIVVDVTDFAVVDRGKIVEEIRERCKQI